MQISEMFRRGIVVAKNNQSEIELSNWVIKRSVYVEFLPIIDNELFVKLYKLGLFSDINKIGNYHIDDYEEECVDCRYIPEIIKVVNGLLNNSIDIDVKRYLSDFFEMLNYAAKNGRNIYFIF